MHMKAVVALALAHPRGARRMLHVNLPASVHDRVSRSHREVLLLTLSSAGPKMVCLGSSTTTRSLTPQKTDLINF